jgi:hypothetical protein
VGGGGGGGYYELHIRQMVEVNSHAYSYPYPTREEKAVQLK